METNSICINNKQLRENAWGYADNISFCLRFHPKNDHFCSQISSLANGQVSNPNQPIELFLKIFLYYKYFQYIFWNRRLERTITDFGQIPPLSTIRYSTNRLVSNHSANEVVKNSIHVVTPIKSIMIFIKIPLQMFF